MVDRGRPLIGFESHNVFENEGSPFTYITSAFQDPVFVLKINTKIFFNDIRPSKDYQRKMIQKQMEFIQKVTEINQEVDKSMQNYYDMEPIKQRMINYLGLKKTCDQQYPQAIYAAKRTMGKMELIKKTFDRINQGVDSQLKEEMASGSRQVAQSQQMSRSLDIKS